MHGTVIVTKIMCEIPTIQFLCTIESPNCFININFYVTIHRTQKYTLPLLLRRRRVDFGLNIKSLVCTNINRSYIPSHIYMSILLSVSLFKTELFKDKVKSTLINFIKSREILYTFITDTEL